MPIYRVQLEAFGQGGLGLVEADNMSEAVGFAMEQSAFDLEVEEMTEAEADALVAAFIATQDGGSVIQGPVI